MNRSDLRAALAHPNVAAFLAVIDLGEHGPNADSDDRYRTMYGGGLFDAPPWEHPRRAVTVNAWTSTAAGRGQFLAKTWDGLVRLWGFEDFSPPCQNEAMVALIAGRKALDDVIAGRFEEAIRKCAKEWASLPGSPYGQPTLTMREAKERYHDSGGRFVEDTAAPLFNPDSLETERYDQPEAAMPAPLVPIAIAAAQAFLPRLVELIPTLGAAFGSGSEVQKRNVAAAAMLAEAVTKTVGEPNLQAAIERIEREPEKLAEVRAAVAEILPTLTEAGGGGIDGARKANAAGSDVPLFKDRAFLVALVLMAAVFMLLADVFYMNPGNYDSNIRTQIVTAVLGFAGIVGAYFLGSSAGSQRKTNILANKE